MKPFKILPLLALLLIQLMPAIAQTRYRESVNQSGTVIKRIESVPGSLVFDTPTTSGVSGTTPQRIASRFLVPYAPEVKAVVSPAQFGTGKYYSPNFTFCLDAFGDHSVNERKSWGINLFTPTSTYATWPNYNNVSVDWRSQMTPGDGMIYWTQNNLGPLTNPVPFHITALADFANTAWALVPALGTGDLVNYKRFVLDLETTIFGVNAGQSGGAPVPGWTDQGYFDCWDCYKNQSIQLESENNTITIEQLALRGQAWWDFEMHVRRANRIAILLEIAKKKSAAGTLVSAGYSPWINTPATGALGGNSSFFEGNCNVQNIGGDSQGNITLNIPIAGGNVTFSLPSNMDALGHQHFLQGYWYETTWSMDQAKEQAFFVNKTAPQTAQWFWENQNPVSVMAKEKGWIQLNREITKRRNGQSFFQPMMRQVEPVYEFGPYRWPMAEVQYVIRYNNPQFRDTPRPHVPPYVQYGIYAVTRFFAGNELGWGFYMFPIDLPDVIMPFNFADPEGRKYYNFSLHGISAMLQARADLQPYETYYPGSTLVEDPDVQPGQSGDWQNYNGTQALNYNGGTQGAQRPAYMLRYKSVPGGWRVVIIGGMGQNWGVERIDNVRVPGGLLNGNILKCKLRGPGVHVYEFLVKNTDSGQTYEALPSTISAWEKPGYSGRVGSIPSN